MAPLVFTRQQRCAVASEGMGAAPVVALKQVYRLVGKKSRGDEAGSVTSLITPHAARDGGAPRGRCGKHAHLPVSDFW